MIALRVPVIRRASSGVRTLTMSVLHNRSTRGGTMTGSENETPGEHPVEMIAKEDETIVGMNISHLHRAENLTVDQMGETCGENAAMRSVAEEEEAEEPTIAGPRVGCCIVHPLIASRRLAPDVRKVALHASRDHWISGGVSSTVSQSIC
uniref:Uncharacterized protein n=1 Tax=Lotharella globosa TaxID=91324 RepID=A0A7S3ZAC5_9EUKA|mmetsp:Transcript_5291/g.9486  ORF Transcript_5291/g.9486 Transcript_5291/m.9486 type:complete len:150 (+) Transcript_5291:109-558(+)